MTRLLRTSLVTLIALAAVVLAPSASAAPASTTFAIVGYEYAFTPTVGAFAGRGIGNAGDLAAWNATVQHDRLGSTPTYVNGGVFQMATANASGHTDTVTGTFAFHGGTITTLDPGAGCTNQQYLVTGTLKDVATTTTSGGTGTFAATLTHFRTRLFGHCIAYRARVRGQVKFAY